MVKLTIIEKSSASKSVDKGFKRLNTEVNKLLSVINTSDINISYYFTCLNTKDEIIIFNDNIIQKGTFSEHTDVSKENYEKLKLDGYIDHEKIETINKNTIIVIGVKNINSSKDVKHIRIIEQLIINTKFDIDVEAKNESVKTQILKN